MNHWCESCARKNLCYVVDDRPKCFVPITNTAHGTPQNYLVKAMQESRDGHEIAKDEPKMSEIPTGSEPQTERYCTNCKHNGVLEDHECRECHGMDKHEFIEPQK